MCYDLPQNLVFELRRQCINQDETGSLLPLPTTIYTIVRPHALLSTLHHHLVSSLLEGWRAAITVGTNDGPLTWLSNR